MLVDFPTPQDVEFRREMARLRADNDALVALFLEPDPVVEDVWWAVDASQIFKSSDSRTWCPWRVFSSREDAVKFVRSQARLEV